MMGLIVIAVAVSLLPAPREFRALGSDRECSLQEIDRAVSSFAVDDQVPAEGYRLTVCDSGISIRASDAAGAFYAGQTLRQMMTDGRVPCCQVVDSPRFPWRGLHLDESRHFFGKAVVLRLLETMSRCKLNVLHWHLTDDQGWRIPIARYPKLTAMTRPFENRNNFRDLGQVGTYGPYSYTCADLAEIVRRARDLHIRIVPEIEIPGHSRIVLAAYPELACSLDDRKVDNVVCVGKDSAIRFYEQAIDAVCEVFPDAVVHVGGDECDRGDWKRCPDCRIRMKREGLADVAALQAWVTSHFERYLARKGRRLMGWDEIAEGGLPPSAMVMSWRGTSTGIVAAKNGHDVVMTPNEFCYFDYDQCIKGDTVPYMIDWTVPLPWAKVYTFDPVKGIPAGFSRHVLGAQGNNWSEKTCTEEELQWKMWPRAAALAEVLWTYPEKRDIAEFSSRLERFRQRLVASDVNAAPVRLAGRREPLGRMERKGDRIEYRCGKTCAELMIENGRLLLVVNGRKERDFRDDGPFFELEEIELEPGSYLVTARRKGNEIVVVVSFDGEEVKATDRCDG